MTQEAPLLAPHLPKSHSHDASIEVAAVGKNACFRDEATLNSEEIKAVAIAIIELCLSEGISKGVSK